MSSIDGRTIISARSLSHVYHGGVRALDGVDFDLSPGETIVVVGPNGSGKTTLLFRCVGIFSGEGRVTMFGADVSSPEISRHRRRLGFLFQNPDDQFFMPTVFEDVSFAIAKDGLARAEVERRVSRALERVGYSASMSAEPHHLSFGEKKRVALAGALINDPDLLILDEPTLGLDPPGRREFMGILSSIKSAKLISTHDEEVVRRLATKIMYLERGRRGYFGPADDFFVTEHASRFFGAVPGGGVDIRPAICYNSRR